jgi:SARP family transcriptional regulator, regulator of embCAB operon
MTADAHWRNVGVIMADLAARIQICGRLAIEIAGERREGELPGRQGRVLFTYLVLHRHEELSRTSLVDALWPAGPPDAADVAVNALLSKLRGALGAPAVSSRGSVRLRLPDPSIVDLEWATDAIHRAESAYALGEWSRAWAAAQTTMFTARRGFLPDERLDWAEAVRRRLAELYRRALETYAGAALKLGGTELPTAERACRELVVLAPFRESGHRLLMETLLMRGNAAEALVAYDQLRSLLRDELGVAPSEQTRDLHERVLAATVV